MTTYKSQIHPIKIVIIVALTVNFWGCSKKEQTDNQINIGFSAQIKSEIFDKEREILIHLPVGYNESEDNYPVMVLIDGSWHFNHVSTMSDFLQQVQRSPGLIIVGVDHTNRLMDLTPPAETNPADSTIGGADRFLEYIETEVIPYIEQNYRTSQYRLLAGSSLGGLFTFHTMMNRPDLFDAYISLSPSLWREEKRQVGKIIDYLESNKSQFKSPLFMTVANETGATLEGVEEIAEYLENSPIKGLRWGYNHYPEESHISGTFRGMYDGIELVFKPLAELQSLSHLISLVDEKGIAAIDASFESLSNLYGRKVTIGESTLNSLGYRYLSEERAELAIVIFKENTEKYPDSPNVWDSLGDGYLAMGLYQEAVSSFEHAVSKAREIEDPDLSTYESSYEKAKLEFEEYTTD